MRHPCSIASLLIVLVPSVLTACLWDSDTIDEERRQFPTALELITGKFLRHSPAFYKWRIEDRKKRLLEKPENVALYDDLAVAYEKTGQTDLAIETMMAKEKIKPGLYETYANLGTFYIHAGRLEEGLEQIEKAIEINPNAHFGREVYQKLLVEYVLLRRDSIDAEPPNAPTEIGTPLDGFSEFVLERQWSPDGETSRIEEAQRAAEGILGMMRFGNHDSPILLEAFAQLAIENEGLKVPKLLAARAWLKASYVTNNADHQKLYRQLAESVLSMQTRPATPTQQVELAEIEVDFRKELDEASVWHTELVENERRWINSGLNPEDEFAKAYPVEPEIEANTLPPGEADRLRQAARDELNSTISMAVGVVLMVLVFLIGLPAVFLAWWLVRRIRRGQRTILEDTSFTLDQNER